MCRKGYLKDVAPTCKNVSDFEAFDHILSNGSVFEEIPDFRALCSSLRKLKLENSRLTQLRRRQPQEPN
ncbi:hypothetical protein CEXT_644651 [Caerostris extrusa]|uniref:Uncharacterized protein n=1 Tax=Caerostris extrusa TaxID=172846 RepID=A0AAV4Q0D9_CAEEX|nr:hypothetical protein CEXT_644651 [Caerostris extrusa]